MYIIYNYVQFKRLNEIVFLKVKNKIRRLIDRSILILIVLLHTTIAGSNDKLTFVIIFHL